MAARVSAFIVWALVAAGIAFWGLRIFVRPAPVPPHATPVSTTQTARGEVVRVFADPAVAAPVAAQPALASRFKLIGVMAPKAGDRPGGVALIAVDDKPPRAFVVGAQLDTNLVLQTVSMRSAAIGSPQGGAPAVVLELPPLPPPATGTLPPPGAGGVSPPQFPAGGPPPPAQAPLTPPPTPAPPPQMMQPPGLMPPPGVMPPAQGGAPTPGRPSRQLQR
jgi:general secretion pathway protein C